MDHLITLKKKLSTYVSDKGYFKNVPDEIYHEVLCAWEQWTGVSTEFYRTLGFSTTQLAGIVGKAKKMKRDGLFPATEFKEVKVESPVVAMSAGPCQGAELLLQDGRMLRFNQVDLLLEFLKKSA